jgi:K+-sensing histidine kinase KdpD
MDPDITGKTQRKEEWRQADLHAGRTVLVDATVESMGVGLKQRTYQRKQEPPQRRQSIRNRGGYGIALVSTLIAFLLRWSLDSYLHEDLPFAAFLIAVAITTCYGGVGASVTAVVIGGFICNWFFVNPRYEFALTGPVDQAGVAIYVTVSFAMVGFVQTWRWAWRRSEEMAVDLQYEIARKSGTEE